MMPESLWDVSRVVEVGAVRSMSPRGRLDARARLGLAARAGDSAAASAALAEIAARRVYWSERLESPTRRGRVRPVVAFGAIFLFTLWVVPQCFAVVLVGVIVVLVFAGWLGARLASERGRLLTAMDEGVCPDCGYAVARDIPGGPEACSECGSPWPLVPPEI